MNCMYNDNRLGINPRVIVSNMDDPISIDYTSVSERLLHNLSNIYPDSKIHWANMNMVPIWGRQDPGGPHVDPMNFAIW